MKVECPSCRAVYNLQKPPPKRSMASCKKCGQEFVIEPQIESGVAVQPDTTSQQQADTKSGSVLRQIEGQKRNGKKHCSECGKKIKMNVADQLGIRDPDYHVCMSCVNKEREFECKDCGNKYMGKKGFTVPKCPACTSKNVAAMKLEEPRKPSEKSGELKNTGRSAVGGQITTKKVLSVVGTFVVIVLVLSALFGGCGESIKVEGDVAKARVEAVSTYSKKTLAFSVSEVVFKAIEKYPEVKRVEVTVMMSALGLTDKYGNQMKEDVNMGTIAFPVDDEARRYKTAGAFASAYENYFLRQVNLLSHVYLLD